MRHLRHAAVLVVMLFTTFGVRAVAQKGPEPSDIIHPRGASAAEAVERESSSVAGAVPRPTSGSILTTVGYVLFILLLIGGGVYLLKRGSLPRPFNKGEGRLKVLENRMLGNRQFLLVVEYDDARMLLGVCPGRIDYLTPLAGHPLADPAIGAAEDEVPAGLAKMGIGGRS